MKKITVLSLLLLCLLIIFPMENAEAKSYLFKYKDATNNKTVKYDGIIPKYVLNGNTLNLKKAQPIITDNYIACAGAEVLFGEKLGAKVSYSKSKKRLTIIYGGHELKLFVGQKECLLDGEPAECPELPIRIKYSESKEVATLVPTRFVASSLGISYSWDSDSDTVTMVAPLQLTVNNEPLAYTGTRGKIIIHEKEINVSDTPSIIISNNALICARKELLQAADIEMTYNEETGVIRLVQGSNVIDCCIGSRIAYVNDILTVAPVEPSLVEFIEDEKTYIYLPGRFIFESFGFYYEWNADKGTSSISGESAAADTNESDKSYQLIKTVNPDEGYTFFVSTEDCGQYMDIPLPEGVTLEDVKIEEDYMASKIKLLIPGNQSELYRDYEFTNTGDCILQLRIYYNAEKDCTELVFLSSIVLDIKLFEAEDNYFEAYIDYTANIHKKIIVIDAGHGGHDPGAISQGYNESDLNLKIVQNCKTYFDKSDIKVYYTRLTDVFYGLYERAAVAGMVGADMFIAVHHNSSDSKASKGTGVYYGGLDTYESLNGLTSAKLAEAMQANLVAALNTKDNGITDRNFVVVRDSEAPAVLLEIGFMSNPDELKRIAADSFSKKAAKTIYKTVKQIYKAYK